MKKYDIDEFDRIKNLISTNLISAKKKIEDYLKKYPMDYTAYNYYALILIELGLIDDAIKITDYSLNLVNSDNNYKKEDRDYFMHHNILNNIRILSFQKRYDELLNYYNENMDKIIEKDTSMLPYYCKKKLNILDDNNRDIHSYIIRQIIDYKEEDFIRLVKSNNKRSKMYFNDDFPYDAVIEEVKKYIPSNIRIFSNFYEDEYSFKYNKCGVSDGKVVDYFKVVCLNDTNNIMAMKPSSYSKNKPQIDLNYLRYSLTKENTKRLTQVEKFNKKYKKIN